MVQGTLGNTVGLVLLVIGEPGEVCFVVGDSLGAKVRIPGFGSLIPLGCFSNFGDCLCGIKVGGEDYRRAFGRFIVAEFRRRFRRFRGGGGEVCRKNLLGCEFHLNDCSWIGCMARVLEGRGSCR